MRKILIEAIGRFLACVIIIVIGNIVIVAQGEGRLLNYEFQNGNWFNGKGFDKRNSFYSVGGLFSRKRPKRVDKVVDLKNGYVVPPFGDAHNHTLVFAFNLKSFSKKLFRHGIFYIKNPNNVARFADQLKGRVNKPDTIDIALANGGLTGTDGHPTRLYDVVLANGPYQRTGIKSYKGLAYYIIDNENDLDEKWDKILADKPGFIKTYLLYSEKYAERRDDKEFYGSKGLDPAVLPKIVKKAHQAGFRVSTHVNTAYDFGVAVRAGVDEINHLPGRSAFTIENLEQYRIAEADAKMAGKKGIYVVPTYSLFQFRDKKEEDYSNKARQLQRDNLKMLHKYGVRITFGPDTYNNTSQLEAYYIRDLGIFSNLELLRMWAVHTPKTIFPRRRIARLKNGYEASFVVAPKNPLQDFDTLKNLNYRFKQGVPILIEGEE